MSELNDLRAEIDAVDGELAALFLKRMELTRRVGAYKQKNGIPVLDAGREHEVLAKRAALTDDPAKKADLTAFFESVMAVSRRRQRTLVREADNEEFRRLAGAVLACRDPLARPRILYQGEPGAYAEEGAVRFFGEDCGRDRTDTWEEIFLALREGAADYGVLPIETAPPAPSIRSTTCSAATARISWESRPYGWSTVSWLPGVRARRTSGRSVPMSRDFSSAPTISGPIPNGGRCRG